MLLVGGQERIPPNPKGWDPVLPFQPLTERHVTISLLTEGKVAADKSPLLPGPSEQAHGGLPRPGARGSGHRSGPGIRP